MNYPLTEEQRMFLDSLRGFLEKEIYPHEAEADRAGAVAVETTNIASTHPTVAHLTTFLLKSFFCFIVTSLTWCFRQ